jgi:hypothetical protein
MSINSLYIKACNTPSDINEHLPVLREYASRCKHITEMGVRAVTSTWAFLDTKPEKLISYDIERHQNIDFAEYSANEESIDFTFHEKDVLKVDIEKTDLLFIDTLHIYSQLKKELNLHAGKVSKYIILHDTTTYGSEPEPSSWQTGVVMENYKDNDKGIWPAVEEFLASNKEWSIELKLENNNGLTILKRN